MFFLFPPLQHFSLCYPSNGTPFLVCQLQTADRCWDTILPIKMCSSLHDIKKFPQKARKWDNSKEVREARETAVLKSSVVFGHIFLICLVWNSSFSNSGFVTFSEGIENIWTPYGSHLLFAKWSYILFSKPFISSSTGTNGVLNISTTDYNITSESLNLLTQIPRCCINCVWVCQHVLPYPLHLFQDYDNTKEHIVQHELPSWRQISSYASCTQKSRLTKIKEGDSSTWWPLQKKKHF